MAELWLNYCNLNFDKKWNYGWTMAELKLFYFKEKMMDKL